MWVMWCGDVVWLCVCGEGVDVLVDALPRDALQRGVNTNLPAHVSHPRIHKLIAQVVVLFHPLRGTPGTS